MSMSYISLRQFNRISLISIVLFLTAFSTISYSGKEEKEAAENAVIKHLQIKDNTAIDSVMKQTESFRTFFIDPGVKIENVASELPKETAYPLSSWRATTSNAMLNAIYLFSLLRSILKDTVYSKTSEYNRIEAFFKKLEDWKKCTDIEETKLHEGINRKNDLSEMAINISRSQISKTVLSRDGSMKSNGDFVKTSLLIDNEMASHRLQFDSTVILSMMLNFLSASGKEKALIKQSLEDKLYLNINTIDKKLLEVNHHPEGEDFPTLINLIRKMVEFRTKVMQNGVAYTIYCPDAKTLQDKKNDMIDLIENEDSQNLKKEITYAMKALRTFTINRDRQYKFGLILKQVHLAIDSDPNDYRPGTSS